MGFVVNVNEVGEAPHADRSAKGQSRRADSPVRQTGNEPSGEPGWQAVAMASEHAPPVEFTAEYIDAHSVDAFTPYADFLDGREPYASIRRANPWLRPPRPGEELEWGAGWYYDTTVGREHPYWKDKGLPEATKDIRQMRRDLHRWGYCLIEDGLSSEQVATMRRRLEEQAEGERIAGVANMTAAFQIVWALVNKGDCFTGCVEMDPAAVQAGPVVERLMDETLGSGWYSYSFVSNIAFPGCHPQALHQDQGAIHPFQTPEAPVLLNTLYVMQDVDDHNGGTLFIPGSHRTISKAGSGGEVGELPPAINLEAKAGTLLVFDGRMLHGTGVNHSDEWRYVMTQSNVKPWLRQQENWILSVRPEVIEAASPKLLDRMGFQATATWALAEGHGTYGSGRPGDPNGDLAPLRLAADRGDYRRIGELTPELAQQLGPDAFTLQAVRADARARSGNEPPKGKLG